ncbi:GmrSD restriction endonuclease domain-containing protein [Massilia niabensis]|uniref:DUF262 domain-containing protein n=1 Tax=Massilia niabensis TaxID=544910 RepID=A0ABW0L3B3_9BURK
MNYMLSLAEIAAWQIASAPAQMGTMVAALPALQRGAVWKVKQIEELWDSMLRQFPIGAFIVSPIDAERGHQRFKLQQDGLPEASHHLLDGQQRATGIALGFADVWKGTATDSPVRSACWIDLGTAPSGRDVDFVARVQTQAHPWGYSRTDPDARLPQNKIRAAIKAFQAVNPEHHETRPEAFPLTLTWPWDSVAPVPLPMLLSALDAAGGDVPAAIKLAWDRVQTLPMFNATTLLDEQEAGDEDSAIDTARGHLEACRNSITAAFLDELSPLGLRLHDLMSRLALLLASDTPYRIPVLHLELDETTSFTVRPQLPPGDSSKKDPVELLFVRINSAGTPLGGEELVYSLLKSAWVEAPAFVETLVHKPAGPARIAMLCIRLVLARQQRLGPVSSSTSKRFAFPASLSVDEFRRLMRGHESASFQDGLRRYIKEEAAGTFEGAWQFLADSKNSFALPRVVAAELAQKAPDVFFLLLAWLDRLTELGSSADRQSAIQHRRTLGFLTAVAWFGLDKTKAVAMLWDTLQAETDAGKLLDFFNRRHFSQICRLDERLDLHMIPLVGADELDLICKKRITGYFGCQDTITRQDSRIWKDWGWYGSFVEPAAAELKTFYSAKLYPTKTSTDGSDIDVPESALTACDHFLGVLWNCHPILLFAQRKWLANWFPHFNPALPEFMEDKNRPWDYDHIHPQSYLRSEGGNALRGMPQVIKDWHGSIGNLRAWPLEINRSDSDSTPELKLDSVAPIERRYGLTQQKHKLEASFVEKDELVRWQESLPAHSDKWYLKAPGAHDERCALVRAIVGRFNRIYREWYQTLRLADLQ